MNLTLSVQVNPEDATPMMRQFLEVKQQYPGIILFYRMGDFYETFFEDAVIAARALEITLTGRDAGKLGRVPMAGVPVKAVDNYLQKLLEKNFKIAICEQVEEPALAKGLVERRVTRLLSSGTIADQRFLKPAENNFLAAACFAGREKTWGFAYCDVTTGEFYAVKLSEEQFINELDRIKPSELLVIGKKQKGVIVEELVPDVPIFIRENYRSTALYPEAFDTRRATERILKWFSIQDIDSFGLRDQPDALKAAGAILSYLEQTYLEESRPVFESIRLYRISERMEMNAATRRNLELTHTIKDGRAEGTLLWVLDRTCTSMGGRLIRQWLQSPSVDLKEINSRLDAVEALVMAPQAREELRKLLPDIYDLERLSMKIQNLSALPRDMTALKRSCQKLPLIAKALEGETTFYLALAGAIPCQRVLEKSPSTVSAASLCCSAASFTSGVNSLPALLAPCICSSHGTSPTPSTVEDFAEIIEKTLLETPQITIKEGNLFKSGYNQELDQLRTVIDNQQSWLESYEQSERERTGIKTLKIGMNSAFGYYMEISKALSKQAPPEYQRKQTLTNAERYITPELKQHEDQVFEAQAKLYELEYQLFLELREKLLPYGSVLKETAQRISTLDLIQSLAHVAVEQGYVRPEIDNSSELALNEARHPVVEKILPLGKFVSNDCTLSAASTDHRLPQLMIITGPNMSGKSTYMRQVALIAIMAQMGSFVPASYARIGLIDQLFTRIGAVDDLASGQSTFMVEMTETAHILNCASERSLVLLDEVGRGTSTYDGVSIAWSVAEHLIDHNGCRTLFATHYHELNTLEQVNHKIQNYKVLVSESEGEIEFLHRVVPGAAQKSYGIQVAKMAGIPSKVIRKAERLMNRMQEKEFTAIEKRKQTSLLEVARQDQLSLFSS